MGALSRRKGRRFEQELVHLFREAMPGAEEAPGLEGEGGGHGGGSMSIRAAQAMLCVLAVALAIALAIWCCEALG